MICPSCNQESIDSEERWCEECLANRWNQEFEVLELFTPAPETLRRMPTMDGQGEMFG